MAINVRCKECHAWCRAVAKECHRCGAPFPRNAGVWRVNAVDGHGHRHRHTYGAKSAAERVDTEITYARNRGEPWGERHAGITLGALRDAYLASPHTQQYRDLKQRRNSLALIIRALGETLPATRLSQGRIQQYQEMRAAEGVTNSPINREVTYLNVMLTWATPRLLPVNPILGHRRLRENASRWVVMPPARYDVLAEAIPERSRAALALLYHLPLRIGEAARLTWDQVSLEGRGFLRFSGQGTQRTKSGRPRRIPLWYPRIHELLSTLAPVFPAPESSVFGITRSQFEADWRVALASTGMDYHVHDLKHAAITALVHAGVPAHEIMHSSDHADAKIMARYANISEQMMDQLPQEAYDPASGLILPMKRGTATPGTIAASHAK